MSYCRKKYRIEDIAIEVEEYWPRFSRCGAKPADGRGWITQDAGCGKSSLVIALDMLLLEEEVAMPDVDDSGQWLVRMNEKISMR